MTPEQQASAMVDTLGPQALAKAAAYTAGNHWLMLWGFLVFSLFAFLIVRSRLLERLPQPKSPFLRSWLIAAGFLFLASILGLAWDIWAEWMRETRYGRTSQPLADWLSQYALSSVLEFLFGGLFAAGLYAVIRKGGRGWWLWSGGFVAAVLTFMLILSPTLIEPLFNDYAPLPEGPVRAALEVQAEAAGVPADRIFVYDGSRQSNNFTANVSGVLGSARIAISDVALNGADLDEVRAVTGHEIGHYVLGHVWRTVLLFSALAILAFFLVDRLYSPVARFLGVRVGIADPLGFPAILVAGSAVALLLQPLVNANTRRGEREADRYSLETVNLPDALASALLKTAEYRYPRPARLQEMLFYTHPSVERRIAAAMQWKAEHPQP
jgi:STE24 endopeptidase